MSEGNDNEPLEKPENVLIPEIVEDVPECEAGEGAPEETGDLIEDAVQFINYTTRKMLSDYALNIGDYLLMRFFNDDALMASSTDRYKNASFSQLCKRPDISLTRQTMGEMVRMAAQFRIFNSISIDISPLNYTKQLYLTRLPHSETKLDLAMECLNEGMMSDALLHRIQEIQKALNSQEPGLTPPEKLIDTYSGVMTRFVKNAVMSPLFADRDQLYGLESDTRTRLRQTAGQWMADMEAKRLEYQTILDNLDYINAHPNS